jgi:hypothetical protein
MDKGLSLIALLILSILCPAMPANANDAEKQSRFVSARGPEIVSPDGSTLMLRGINLGNWLVPEGYMFGFKVAAAPWQIQQVVKELVGTEANNAFWARWQDVFVTQEDIRYIRRTGMNVIRIPFDYRQFTPEEHPDVWIDTGFRLIDKVVEWSAEEGLYVILDMHAAPCGQTGRNIDNSYGFPHLFEDKACQQRMAEVWRRIAEHYASNTTVIGYDLLNEPLPREEGYERYNPLLEELYKTVVSRIREVDRNHLIFLSGAHWGYDFSVFRDIGFDTKLVYTFHSYWAEPNERLVQPFVEFRRRHQVPIFLGESGENTDEWIKAFREVLDSNRIGWTFWPYKQLSSSRSPRTYDKPPHWDEIVAYQSQLRIAVSERRKLRPATESIQSALQGLLNNVLFVNTRANEAYLRALGMDYP